MSDLKVSRPVLWEWFLLVFLFLFFRISGLLLFHPLYNDMCPLEEYYRGAIAREFLDGPFSSLWQFRADNFGGGSLVMGILTAGLFKLFGASAFVLRLLPVFISLAALLLWFRLLRRDGSEKMAWYFALFFILSPAFFQSFSMVPLGDHYETIFLSSLAVTLFLDLYQKGFSRLRLLLLGLLCGFGIWFAYIFVLTVVALTITWFALSKRGRPRSLHLFPLAGGFLLGFSPWIISNFRSGFSGLWIQETPVWQTFQPVFSADFWRTYVSSLGFVRDIFGLFSHPDLGWGLPSIAVNYLYVFLMILPLMAWIILRSKISKSSAPPSPLVAFFTIFSVLYYSAMELTVFNGERYMLPWLPALFFFWAKFITDLESISSRSQKIIRVIFVFPTLGLGFVLWLSMLSPAYAGFLLKTSGVAYDYISGLPPCYVNGPSCLSIHEEVLTKVPNENRKDVWISLASKASGVFTRQDPESALAGTKIKDPEFAEIFYFYYGQSLFYSEHYNLGSALSKLRSFSNLSPSVLKLCELGIFYAFGGEPLVDMRFIPKDLSRELVPDYFRERGKQITRFWRNHGQSVEFIYEAINAVFPVPLRSKERAAFLQGLGHAMILKSYEEPIQGHQAFLKIVNLFAPEDQRAIFQGVGLTAEIFRQFLPVPCQSWGGTYLRTNPDPKIQEWIKEGRERIDRWERA